MKNKPTYDPICLDVAEHFLTDEPKLLDRAGELAAHVQAEIEAWIIFEREKAWIISEREGHADT